MVQKIRKNTVLKTRKKGIIEVSKQNIIGILGIRGSGKSVTLEALLERYWDAGYTVLDLWSAPNLENAFWIFNTEGSTKRIPVTILAPESLDVDSQQVNRFNDSVIHASTNLVKFVKLPNPTKKTDSEQNNRILDILTSTILECRESRRILVFNPYMFPNESNMFRILEILMRNLITISHAHFHAIQPKDVGKTSRKEMTMFEKTHHKIAVGIREFGEVAPARIKGDKSGESTLIKKALLKFVRLARHASVDLILDYQNASDAESAVRNQIDIWLLKRWTPDLAGEYFEYIFKRIEMKRKKILDDWKWSKEGFRQANSLFPNLENLTYYWMYVKKHGVQPYLVPTPILHTRHKNPDDKWEILTGIEIKHDPKLVEKAEGSSSQKVGKREEKAIMMEIKSMREREGKKKLKWTEIKQKLAEMQDKDEISKEIDFKDMKEETLRKKFNRWLKDQDNS